MAIDSFSTSSSGGSASPSLSLRTATADDSLSTLGDPRMGGGGPAGNGAAQQQINLQIFVPELQMQKCLSVPLDELVWDIKRRLLESLPQQIRQHFNFGLFLPPCDGRAGKFLLEDRPIRDYPFHDCVPYVELKYKKRVYKMLRLDEKALRAVHSKSNLRKFAEAIQQKNAQKVERLCTMGLDPNFHDTHGETPLTLASGIPGSREVLVQLVGGGAHLDFRNTEGQTGMHKAAFLSVPDNVRALLELGASPNYRDMIGLTPLYYNMLSTDSNPEVAEMLLAEAAELEVVDMHGNTALHQACKNGLAKHVEQLLFYGADMNARNVNGNSPLHVCAVNGRVECAQVLLYRGADPTLMNRQSQSAMHVAQIVGSLPVADVIRGHSPHNIVPFREPPKINPRRRLSSRQISVCQDGQIRRRSLSHCSSSSSTIASTQQHQRYSTVANMGKLSPSPSMASSATDYGTLRRIAPDSVQHQQPGFEPNIPRILVIPRGPKGFGFILRGARHVDSMQLDFHPTLAIPALQFFEGVDMQGMAMRAGLRPGDFLLEINGVDVRAASHEQVVQLIHQSGATITLKVITVVTDTDQQSQQQIYAASAGAANYATIGRRNHSVPRGQSASSMPPPPPPQRNPSTTLSFGRAFAPNGGVAQFCTADLPPPSPSSPGTAPFLSSVHSQHILPHRAPTTTTTTTTTDPAQQQQQIRCASVKLSRTSAVRRISAVELEHLMVQQGSSQQQQTILLGPEQQQQNGAPKKFTSVAEMKRRKQQPIRANSISNDDGGGDLYGSSMLKNSTSSPDLPSGIGRDWAEGSHQEDGRRHVLRPKTPPPPPPPSLQRQTCREESPPPEPAQQPIYASTVLVTTEPMGEVSMSASAIVGPPAPPPPPPNLLLRPTQPSTSSAAAEHPQPRGGTEKRPTREGGGTGPNRGGDCRGVSAEALRSVRLKPVPSIKRERDEKEAAANPQGASNEKTTGNKFAPPANFDSDLRSALAKRRNKVRGAEEGSESGNEEGERKVVSIVVGGGGAKGGDAGEQRVMGGGGGSGILIGRYTGGLSLRESVLENVTGATGKGSGQNGCAHKMAPNSSHSPPGGFIGTKKDSGYTSSRTSLEPSECGDCLDHGGQQHNGPLPSSTTNSPSSLPVQHRVNVISQQLMIDHPPATAAPLSGLGSKPAVSAQRVPSPRPHPGGTIPSSPSSSAPLVRIPPVDYDQSDGSQTSTDSGNQTDLEQVAGSRTSVDHHQQGEQEHRRRVIEKQHQATRPRQRTGQFRQRAILEWAPEDVSEWLEELDLADHCAAFASIHGNQLLRFDRARYTALGVTRVGDRQKMEQSLKEFRRE